jgi:hypothetical protein
MLRKLSRALVLTVAAVVATGALAAVVSPAQAAGSLTASYVLDGTWTGNYQAHYTVVNGTTATVSSWKIEFDLAADTTISSSWDGVVSRSGNHITVNNASYNAPLNAGGSATFGFIASGSTQPTNCRINGGLCAGGAGDTTAPSTPSGLKVTATTSSTVALSWTGSTDNVGATTSTRAASWRSPAPAPPAPSAGSTRRRRTASP